MVVLAGVIRSGAHWFNRTMLFDTSGTLASVYDKVHLTDAERDSFGLTPGAIPRTFEYDGVRIGFATCFDFYFPEHFAALAEQGVDLVLCPSYQRSESAQRIRLLSQARALDSGAYVVRSSYSMGDSVVGGCALIASPQGHLLADAGAEVGVIAADMDPAVKFVKPASFGKGNVEHRSLLEAHRRPSTYRSRRERCRRISESPFPRLCAHRGMSLVCPENTLPAFAAAMSAGAHEIEFDLWASRDGVPVVCHDETVDRTTDGTGRIADMDWADIRRLDAGRYLGEAWAGVRVPRLEEVLDFVDGRAGLNIHIQGVGPDNVTIRRTCDLLREEGLIDIAYLALGTEPHHKFARAYAPEVPRACLVRQDDPARSIAIAIGHGCRRIQFFRMVTKAQIEEAHDAGLICNLFWSDDPADAESYIRKGIDVILTNCAHHLVAAGFSPVATTWHGI